jgi:hypothetical protein
LGEAYGKQGKMADAHYHLGLYHYNRQDDKSAMFHLGKALDYDIEPPRRDQVKKMLEELKKKWLLEEQEKKTRRR